MQETCSPDLFEPFDSNANGLVRREPAIILDTYYKFKIQILANFLRTMWPLAAWVLQLVLPAPRPVARAPRRPTHKIHATRQSALVLTRDAADIDALKSALSRC